MSNAYEPSLAINNTQTGAQLMTKIKKFKRKQAPKIKPNLPKQSQCDNNDKGLEFF